MKISFLLVNEKHPYEGVVRPFLNWGEELSKRAHDVHFLFLSVGKELVNDVRDRNIHYTIVRDFNELINVTRKIEPDILLTDDSMQRLKLISKIKDETNIKTGIYVQILFGSHSIIEAFNLDYLPIKDKLLFNFSKIIPFNLLKKQYRILLQCQDVILANSNITLTFLNLLYGIEPDGVVYPPINMNVFRARSVKKENKVLLYLGSHAGDTDEAFVRKICEIVKKNNYEIFLLGNEILGKTFEQDFKAIFLSKISDEKLAEAYSKCKVVICPQKWETFGYVEAESMACGTPVLAFDCMGQRESIISGKTGWLTKNKQEFFNMLISILNNAKSKIDVNSIRENVVKRFSVAASTRKLENLLRVKLNGSKVF